MSLITDMMTELREIYPDVGGIEEEKELHHGIAVNRVHINTRRAAEAFGKPIGTYITLEAEDRFFGKDRMADILADELVRLIGKPMPEAVLIVGIGNRNVTPDALGPKTADGIFVTRHVKSYLPETLPDAVTETAAVCPGVMGQTGIESCDLVAAVNGIVAPQLIIAVDSLAARRAERMGSMIQMSDTGINPGAGTGNRRRGIGEDTVGTKVIAIGAPLVVYASTVVQDTLEAVSGKLSEQDAERIESRLGELIVTPKEIDEMVEDMANVIACGINKALLGANYSEVSRLMT